MVLLLLKLEYYGLRRVSSDFLRSYLKNKNHYVRINDVDSDILNVKCRVPQGLAMGLCHYVA